MLNDFIANYHQSTRYTPKQTDFILALCQKQIDFRDSMIFRGEAHSEYGYIYLEALCRVADKSRDAADFIAQWETILARPLKDFADIEDNEQNNCYDYLVNRDPKFKHKTLKDLPFNSQEWANLAKLALKHTRVFNFYDVREIHIHKDLVIQLSEIRDQSFAKFKQTRKEYSDKDRKDFDQSRPERQFRFIFGNAEENGTKYQIVQSLLNTYSGLYDIGKPEVSSLILRYLKLADETLKHCPDFEDNHSASWDLSKMMAQNIQLSFALNGQLFDVTGSPDNLLKNRHIFAENAMMATVLQTWLECKLFTGPGMIGSSSRLPDSKRYPANLEVYDMLGRLESAPTTKQIKPDFSLATPKTKKSSNKSRPKSMALDVLTLTDHFSHLTHSSPPPTCKKNKRKKLRKQDSQELPIEAFSGLMLSDQGKKAKGDSKRNSDTILASPELRRKKPSSKKQKKKS